MAFLDALGAAILVEILKLLFLNYVADLIKIVEKIFPLMASALNVVQKLMISHSKWF